MLEALPFYSHLLYSVTVRRGTTTPSPPKTYWCASENFSSHSHKWPITFLESPTESPRWSRRAGGCNHHIGRISTEWKRSVFSITHLFLFLVGWVGPYKICCWRKCKSSEESQQATKKREGNGDKHGECWNQMREHRGCYLVLKHTVPDEEGILLTNVYIAYNKTKESWGPKMQFLYHQSLYHVKHRHCIYLN